MLSAQRSEAAVATATATRVAVDPRSQGPGPLEEGEPERAAFHGRGLEFPALHLLGQDGAVDGVVIDDEDPRALYPRRQVDGRFKHFMDVERQMDPEA